VKSTARNLPKSVENGFHHRSPTQATLLDVRHALKQLRLALLDAGLPQLDISCAEIVVAEVLNNIVKHAQNKSEQGWFEVQCTAQQDGLHIVCRDNGLPMPGGAPPGGVLPNLDRFNDELPEGGWGWSLVRTLSRDLKYKRVHNLNVVSFFLPNNTESLRR